MTEIGESIGNDVYPVYSMAGRIKVIIGYVVRTRRKKWAAISMLGGNDAEVFEKRREAVHYLHRPGTIAA